MGNRPNLKPGRNEIIRRTNILKTEVLQLKNMVDYIHRLLTEYISFQYNDESFKQHLEEIMNANKEESGELRKSSGANSSTGKGESDAKTKDTKKRKDDTDTAKSDGLKSTGESGNIGL